MDCKSRLLDNRSKGVKLADCCINWLPVSAIRIKCWGEVYPRPPI